jgi:carbonic anhydrase
VVALAAVSALETGRGLRLLALSAEVVALAAVSALDSRMAVAARAAGSVRTVMERHRTQPGTRPRTPEEAWHVLAAGNARFMADERAHPHQDVHFRHRVAARQHPFAIFFGCADSRVAAEIIFDQGLGDLFVVRTAGHVVDPSVLGSLEFGVGVLDCPLIVVLGHDSCGAVSAAEAAVRTGDIPGGFLRDIVERVTPSVLAASRGGRTPTIEDIEREHVERTCDLVSERSTLIADRIRSGALGVVGAQYDLADGEAKVVRTIGNLGPVR